MAHGRSRRRGTAGSTLLSMLVVVVLCTFAPASAEVDKARPNRLRVLFVGNSYTYTHDLPQVVASVAATRGVEIVAGMLAEPNFAIEDHLAQDRYADLLDQGWDWVVLQQGPSSLPESRANLRLYSGRAADMARARGIRVALMSAWPALDNATTWANAELSYRLAAEANGVCVLPVASAWRLARAQQPAIELYQRDRLHPEREGTLLAAFVIAQGLSERRNVAVSDLASALPAPDWRTALARAARLDGIARQALNSESPRCVLAKENDKR
jgi:hypothetical protein